MILRIKIIEKGMLVWHIVFAIWVLFTMSAGNLRLFRWLLALGFGLDLVSRLVLYRLYRRAERRTAWAESAGDDVVLAAGVVGMLVFKTEFFIQQCYIILLVDILFLGKTFLSLAKFRKIIDCHTFAGSVASFSQIVFLLLLFFLPKLPSGVFYLTAALTLFSLVEQLVIIRRLEPRHNQLNIKS